VIFGKLFLCIVLAQPALTDKSMQLAEGRPICRRMASLYRVNEHCQGGSLELSLSDALGKVLSERGLVP